jgi:hypothetical protein
VLTLRADEQHRVPEHLRMQQRERNGQRLSDLMVPLGRGAWSARTATATTSSP